MMKTAKWLLALSLTGFVQAALAEDFLSEPEPEREPASVQNNLTVKRNYPGGADEEDLQVQTAIPEATLQTDARSLQREVYKALYNQELKDERQDAVEE